VIIWSSGRGNAESSRFVLTSSTVCLQRSAGEVIETHSTWPEIIQGGMGIGVSNWRLASCAAQAGALGVVSGTGVDLSLARGLQLGDKAGHLRRGLAAFPYSDVTERILDKYFVEGGIPCDRAFRSKATIGQRQSKFLQQLIVAANFVEVYLAREGHAAPIGINYLEKLQAPTLPQLYGAMLAGVDVVLMGAGIPREIPGVLDRLARGESAELPVAVVGDTTRRHLFEFDPQAVFGTLPGSLKRPAFFPIIASDALARMMLKKATGSIEGFVVEGSHAGGHIAPPRGRMVLSNAGEPVFGPRDVVNCDAMRECGLPFWLAGGYGEVGALQRARDLGAAGIQVGSLFALCAESGLSPEIRNAVLTNIRSDSHHVLTDPHASPSGYPFQVCSLEGTNSEETDYAARTRVCDLGYLREAVEQPNGALLWRCAAEPVADFVAKGGSAEATVGRKCLCNGLSANIGMGQLRKDGRRELPLVTCGASAETIKRLIERQASYSVTDVLALLRSSDVCEPSEQPAASELLGQTQGVCESREKG